MKGLLLTISLSLITDLFNIGGSPEIVERDSVYEKIALTESTTLEVFEGDSILVVFTACAPECSSCARVYNKEWELIDTVTPPFSSIFPFATIDRENGRIIWTDNDKWEY